MRRTEGLSAWSMISVRLPRVFRCGSGSLLRLCLGLVVLLPVLAAWLLSLPFWLFERYGRGQ